MDFIALSFSTYNFSLEVVHIVCEDASQDRDEDVEEADDDVGVSSQTVYNFSNMFQLCLQIEYV